jgi:uncharacterized protein YbbK (DUF523 family)
MILISACLLGVPCKYDGGHNFNRALCQALAGKTIFPVCPERLGGLSIPRPTCEITSGDGAEVLRRRARVTDVSGLDRTEAFVTGARRTFILARAYRIQTAVLKQNSPSCGKDAIYDGSFQRRLRTGNGVTAQLLLERGLYVYNEAEYVIKEST